MNLFLESHQEVISFLLQHKVEFIIVGGYAVIYHGYHRTTGDVDVWIKPDNINKAKLITALESYGIESTSLSRLASEDFEKPLAFNLGKEPDKIEFLTHISGVSYTEADQKKVFAEIGQIRIPFLHLHHLILSKLSTGRLKDQADVEELQKVMRFKEDQEN